MKEKVKTIWWFLKNPKYISQISQVRKRKKNTEKEIMETFLFEDNILLFFIQASMGSEEKNFRHYA